MTANTCIRCGGTLLYGEPLDTTTYNDEILVWCRDCIEEYSSYSWPDDWGPYPGTVYPRTRPHRCDA